MGLETKIAINAAVGGTAESLGGGKPVRPHRGGFAGDPDAVKAPFGSGCLELLPLFDSHDRPQAILGATDLAMRQYLPPDILAFTVNMPMYRNLCRLDENSFLSKPFLQRLRKARGGEV